MGGSWRSPTKLHVRNDCSDQTPTLMIFLPKNFAASLPIPHIGISQALTLTLVGEKKQSPEILLLSLKNFDIPKLAVE